MQRRYHSDELRDFLRRIDAELVRPCSIVLVGGAALSLGYCPLHAATELATWSSSDDRLWTATERASAKIARPIHVRQVFLSEPRPAFEARVRPAPIADLRFLSVSVPEAHDHVVLEIARAEPLDFVSSLHRDHPLSLTTLIGRYRELQAQMTGRRQRFEASLLGVVAKLFGAKRAAELGDAL